MKRLTTRSLALILALSALFSLFAVAASAAFETRKIDTGAAFPGQNGSRGERSRAYFADDEIVTAIVLAEGDAAAKTTKPGSAAAEIRRGELCTSHRAILSEIRKAGIDAREEYDYTSVLNGFSLSVRYGDLETIAAIRGVRSVHIATAYEAPADEVKTAFANVMTGASALRAEGIDGKGTVIAILDTGLDLSHEAFLDYGLTDGLDRTTVEKAVADGGVAHGKYISAKVPFAYDYADGDADPSDKEGHGTHVAGIAAGYNGADFSGAAPAAQILAMKIFSDKGGSTYSTVYFKALEDAYLLGADVVNLSIGSPSGFSDDPELESETFGNIYQTLSDAGVIVCAAAGNEYSQGFFGKNFSHGATGEYYVPADYTDFATIGSPATYAGNLSVASTENFAYPTRCIGANGSYYDYVDASPSGELFYKTLANDGKKYSFVMIPGAGAASDYAGLDLAGKIAVVMRGTISFNEKLNAAADAGAIALIVVNTDDETAKMAIDKYRIPAVLVRHSMLEDLSLAAELWIPASEFCVEDPHGFEASGFSSWGPKVDLGFAPMLSGVGGNVFSAEAGKTDGYVLLSGTSMACPCVAGNLAAILSELKKRDPDGDKKARADLALALAESTALRLPDPDGAIVSPRKQGAGLIAADQALAAKVYIRDPLIALGDSEEGKFTFSFTLVNTDDAAHAFEVAALFETDAAIEIPDLGWYNTLTPELLTRDEDYTVTVSFDGGDAVVPAGGTLTATVDFALTETAKTAFGAIYPNGNFIDAFLMLFDADGELPTLHATAFGFFGRYETAPAMEVTDSFDYQSTVVFYGDFLDENGLTFFDIVETNVGINEAYLVGDNPDEDSFGEELCYLGGSLFGDSAFARNHSAISGAEEGYLSGAFAAYPALLRNAEHLVMVVLDEETREVYYVDDTAHVRKNMLNYETLEFDGETYFLWDGTDAEGGDLPDGTRAEVIFYTILPCEEEILENYGEADAFETLDEYYAALVALGARSEWAFRVSIDATAPTFVSAEEKDGDLVFRAKDERYLAGAAVIAQGEAPKLLYSEGADEEEPFAESEFSLALDKIPEGRFVIELYDYATNYTQIYGVKEDGEVHLFDPESGECLFCDDLWGDGETLAALTADEDGATVYFESEDTTIAEILSEKEISYPLAGALAAAKEKNGALDLAFGDFLTVKLDTDAVKALTGEEIFTVSLSDGENYLLFDFSLGGAEFSAGKAAVSVLLEGEEANDLRVYFVDGEGKYEKIACDFDAEEGLLTFETTHFSSYMIARLDAYGHLAEQYADEAEAAKREADALFAEAETIRDEAEAAKLAAEAALEKAEAAKNAAETAKKDADALAEKAEAAKNAAETAKKDADALAEKAEAAEKSAGERLAGAEKAKSDAEAAKVSAGKAKEDAEAALLAAEAARAEAFAALAFTEERTQSANAAKAAAIVAAVCAAAFLAAGVILSILRKKKNP